MSINYTIITDPAKINRSDWSEFVLKHPDGNIFHTPEYYELCRWSPGYSGAVICCLREDLIYGILVSVIQREHVGISGKLSARSVNWGGPLIKDNDPEIASYLLKAFDELVHKEALFSQFRNLSDTESLTSVFLSSGYRFEEHLNILIRLSPGKDHLWKQIHPTRRKQINRSFRRGVTVREDSPTDNAVLDSCYQLLLKVYKREGLPLPASGYFIKAAEIFSEKGFMKLFVAKYCDEIIGFRLVLLFRETIYDWYAASDSSHLDKYPNDILPWEIIKHGAENGFLLFDFGGAGKPGEHYGVRDYKMKFGGEIVSFGRYIKVYKPLLEYIVMSLFRLKRKILNKK